MSEQSTPGRPKGALGDLVKAESMIQLAIALPLGCVVGWFLGHWLDGKFHQSWIGVVGILLGAAGGLSDLQHGQSLHERSRMSEVHAPVAPHPPAEAQTHAEWWASGAAPDQGTDQATDQITDSATGTWAAPSSYTDAQATASLRRAGMVVVALACVGVPVAWVYAGWRGAAAFAVGAAISGSGLWEWRRLMAALMAKMDAQEAVQAPAAASAPKAPSIGFAIAGFAVRLLVVGVVLYASLKYLHGSVPALAAGLAMGVVALTAEAIRLLRSGTI